MFREQDFTAGVPDQNAPLAARMRPRTFDELVGQEHIVGPGKVLRKSIESDQIPSMILWGPPGSGKTTLALLIATMTSSDFQMVSAVISGVADLRKIIRLAKERKLKGGQTILFIDEIHRFNKAQQDVILPHVEDGTVVLIGATTENPSFEVISPLLSRSRVYVLKALTDEQIRAIIERAVHDEVRGLGKQNLSVSEDAMSALLRLANGDARSALNILELAASATTVDTGGKRHLEVTTVEDAAQRKSTQYDRAGDQHYDTISAFIKSVRGSDPDAAIYWLARMLESGEDLMFVARRIVILASEDIGLADPQALLVAVAAQQAAHFIGLPEAVLPLAEATIYLATAPKSNSAYAAYNKAKEDVAGTRDDPVPMHLRNASTSLMRGLGYDKDYKYAHDYAGHIVEQQFLPDNLKGKQYFMLGAEGHERFIKERLEQWYQAKKSSLPDPK
ncbi:MAG: replication-associated recombination protein A [Dehalococcoidia bacterium]|nr:replication-associated recombination protein A [Dehalococcoidia bacterium]